MLKVLRVQEILGLIFPDWLKQIKTALALIACDKAAPLFWQSYPT
jgi:hypothetical protein